MSRKESGTRPRNNPSKNGSGERCGSRERDCLDFPEERHCYPNVFIRVISINDIVLRRIKRLARNAYKDYFKFNHLFGSWNQKRSIRNRFISLNAIFGSTSAR